MKYFTGFYMYITSSWNGSLYSWPMTLIYFISPYYTWINKRKLEILLRSLKIFNFFSQNCMFLGYSQCVYPFFSALMRTKLSKKEFQPLWRKLSTVWIEGTKWGYFESWNLHHVFIFCWGTSRSLKIFSKFLPLMSLWSNFTSWQAKIQDKDKLVNE